MNPNNEADVDFLFPVISIKLSFKIKYSLIQLFNDYVSKQNDKSKNKDKMAGVSQASARSEWSTSNL